MAHRPSLQSRLVEVWTWLPAFRAVAEVQHVQGAARILHVTPSSLSRAIRLLEDRIGKRLFDRVGRNVRLNHDGEELLAAVRAGMRVVDDGLARVTGTVFAGELRVICEGDQPIDFAWRAAARLMAKYTDLRITIAASTGPSSLQGQLLRGEADVAVVSAAGETTTLLVEELGELSYGIYCGEGHPLFHEPKVSLATICAHAFVAPSSSGDDGVQDQWPTSLARIVKLRLPALQPAIALCASGELLAVLPDLAVAEASGRRRLRRLPSTAIPAASLIAVRRRPTSGAVDRAGAFVEELRAEARARLAKSPRVKAATLPQGPSRSRGGRSRRGEP